MTDLATREAGPAIPYVDVETLDPQTRALCERIAGSIGYLPNSMKTYLHRPDIAAALMGLSGALYGSGKDSLPREVQSKLGAVCSVVNGCAYCTSHQCAAMQGSHGEDTTALSDAEVAAVLSGEDIGTTPVERACFAYARAASLDANTVPDSMLAELRAVLSPGQIVELAAIVGMWKLFNTIHDSLHLPIEESKLPFKRFFDAARG